MNVFPHDELTVHEVPRIKTRVLVSADRGATETAVWEQWIELDGYIPLHYHDVEEVLVFLAGEVALTVGEETTTVQSPATVVVPAGQIHGLCPAGDLPLHLLAMFPSVAPLIVAPDGTQRSMPWEDFEGGEAPA